METRLTALEEQVMFLERHIQELDEQVRSLGGDLAAARREVAALRQLGANRYQDLIARIEAADGDVAGPDETDTQPPAGET